MVVALQLVARDRLEAARTLHEQHLRLPWLTHQQVAHVDAPALLTRLSMHLQYDIFDDARRELSFGGGFQLRNARVAFASGDGSQGFTQTNLGIVPLLHLRGRYVFDNALFLETEFDGWASPIPGQGKRNGKLALGSIIDFALRGGLRITRTVETFLTLRYLGGGFRGESSEDTPLQADDPWGSNWLHTLTFSLGLGLH